MSMGFSYSKAFAACPGPCGHAVSPPDIQPIRYAILLRAASRCTKPVTVMTSRSSAAVVVACAGTGPG